MPNIKSAKKRMKTSEESRVANQGVKTRVVSTRRKFIETAATGDKAASEARFRDFCSALDKAAKKGVIKANNASRRKSRAAAHLAAI